MLHLCINHVGGIPVIEEIIRQNRSYRRFDESFDVSTDKLRQMINFARLSPSAANLQPLRYVVSSTPDKNEKIFPCLAWAGYLKDWPGPAKGERPSAYIIMLGDTRVAKNFGCDSGIACQSILLGAVQMGLGGCIIGSVDRDRLRKALKIPEEYDIVYVIALGKPAEKVVIEKVGEDGDIRYYRDSNGLHHVPKRSLDDIIIG
jgi:nitroreductase